MIGFADLTTNIENNRNKLRRIARHDDQEFSNQSILNAMEKFVKTVNAMDETILVPSRLMDRQVGDSTDSSPSPPETPKHLTYGKKKATVRELLNESDLFTLYNMLNSAKIDLMWGRNDETSSDEDLTPVVETEKLPQIEEVHSTTDAKQTAADSQTTPTNTHQLSVSSGGGEGTKGHIRRPSTVSTISTNSTASTISDTESEVSAENDSGIESESNQERDKSVEMAKQFKAHLHGLYKCLEQMTEAANYLTARYQSDIGPV